WLLRCDCGRDVVRIIYSIDRPDTTIKSCGCKRSALVAAARTKHGFTLTATGSAERRTYRSWVSMNERCNHPSNKDYPNYGGRGITICDRWGNFSLFLADMGLRPAGTFIWRQNNDGNYEPSNCRWETIKQQNNNTRANKFLIFNGSRKSLSEWADALEISYSMLV